MLLPRFISDVSKMLLSRSIISLKRPKLLWKLQLALFGKLHKKFHFYLLIKNDCYEAKIISTKHFQLIRTNGAGELLKKLSGFYCYKLFEQLFLLKKAEQIYLTIISNKKGTSELEQN